MVQSLISTERLAWRSKVRSLGSDERPEPDLEIVFGAFANRSNRELASPAVDHEFVVKAGIPNRLAPLLRKDRLAVNFDSDARRVDRVLHLDEM